MISSGWRENRKKIHGKNIYISKDNYKDEERRSFIEKIAAEFVRRSKYKIDLQNKDEDIIFYKTIPVKECTNYDFINCNIYIEGIDGSIDTRSFNNLEAIRNCIFSSCTLVSCYENAIQFRYCEINNCIYDCQLEQLDFSQCFIDIARLYLYMHHNINQVQN